MRPTDRVGQREHRDRRATGISGRSSTSRPRRHERSPRSRARPQTRRRSGRERAVGQPEREVEGDRGEERDAERRGALRPRRATVGGNVARGTSAAPSNARAPTSAPVAITRRQRLARTVQRDEHGSERTRRRPRPAPSTRPGPRSSCPVSALADTATASASDGGARRDPSRSPTTPAALRMSSRMLASSSGSIGSRRVATVTPIVGRLQDGYVQRSARGQRGKEVDDEDRDGHEH